MHTSPRDVIVRIARSVRIARLLETPVAEAIWARLPYYGTTRHTGHGQLCIPIDLGVLDAVPADSAASQGDVAYCLTSNSIVFRHDEQLAPVDAGSAPALLPWARLLSPYPPYVLAAVPHGARAVLLHGDS